jgi:hypothetical protein
VVPGAWLGGTSRAKPQAAHVSLAWRGGGALLHIATGDAGEDVAVAPPDPPDPKPKKRRPPPPKPGHVTVRVNPWAEVFYNGKSYGITPLKNPIEVPPGTATFVLKNPQLQVNKKVSVKVTAGGEVVLKADLFKK